MCRHGPIMRSTICASNSAGERCPEITRMSGVAPVGGTTWDTAMPSGNDPGTRLLEQRAFSRETVSASRAGRARGSSLSRSRRTAALVERMSTTAVFGAAEAMCPAEGELEFCRDRSVLKAYSRRAPVSSHRSGRLSYGEAVPSTNVIQLALFSFRRVETSVALRSSTWSPPWPTCRMRVAPGVAHGGTAGKVLRLEITNGESETECQQKAAARCRPRDGASLHPADQSSTSLRDLGVNGSGPEAAPSCRGCVDLGRCRRELPMLIHCGTASSTFNAIPIH